MATAYQTKIVRSDEMKIAPLWAMAERLRTLSPPAPPARRLSLAPAPAKTGTCSTAGCGCKPCRPPVNASTRPPLIPDDAPELAVPSVLLGYASVFSTSYLFRDEHEAVEPGAFSDVLQSGGTIAALWSHSHGDRLGTTSEGNVLLSQDSYGLIVAIFATENLKARQAAWSVRTRQANAMSIGRCTPPTHRVYAAAGQFENRFGQLSIGEVSIVESPANRATSIECFTAADRPQADPWSEADCIGRERQAAGMPGFVRGDAILKARHERGRLRLRRLAAMLPLRDLFFLSPSRQRAVVREALASMT